MIPLQENDTIQTLRGAAFPKLTQFVNGLPEKTYEAANGSFARRN